MPREIEIQWWSEQGVTYQLRYSDDLGSTWTLLPIVYQGDGTLKSVVFPANEAVERIFTFISQVPKGFNVVTAWDGTYVLLERSPFAPGDKHRIYRDGQLLGTINPNTLTFKDSTVVPGSRYTYTAQIYAA